MTSSTARSPKQTRGSGGVSAGGGGTFARADLMILGGYLLGGLWVTAHLWRDPTNRAVEDLMSNGAHIDQLLFEYFLAHGARILTHAANPLFDGRANFPVGINLMANTSAPGLTVPMAPVTLLFGPPVAFAVLATLAPSSTAAAWYWLFSRCLRMPRAAAFVGGAFCGFGPGVVTETDGHLNIATQFVIPLIVWRVIRLATDRRYVRDGLLLGLLVTYQMFIDEEILLMAVVGCLVFCLVWTVSQPARARALSRRFLTGLAIAVGIALVLPAYPLWFQFFGPGHYHDLGTVPQAYNNDLASFATYPLYSLGGDFGSLQLDYPTLQETFFGLPLMVAVVVIAVVFWRDTAARATAVVALAAGILSLGYRLRYNGAEHYIADFGPWRILGRLPLLESVIPTRFGLAMAPPIGFLLALAVKHIRAYEGPDRYRRIRVIGYAGIAAVLVPLAPTPLAVVGRPPTPSFISSGEWRSHVRPGRTLISLPVSNQVLNMSRAAGQNLDYPFVSGYFLGPDPDSPRGTAMFGTRPRPTEKIWTAVYNDHGMPAVTAADRDRARQDFRYWHAGVIILPPQPRATAIREVTTELVGFPPIRSGGVWVWDLP